MHFSSPHPSATVPLLLALCALSCDSTDPPPIVDHTDYTSASLEPEVFETVTLDTAIKYQTVEGFGASVGWYQGMVPAREDKAEIYPLLFEELGLDILRFRNLYGTRIEDPEDISAEVELYQEATRSLGHPPLVLLTSWSPPGALKASGKEKCEQGDAPESCTLARENGAFVYEKFAQYWVDSLRFYADHGITPDYISIQNEPDFQPSSWEGCVFRGSEVGDFPGYDRALQAVVAALGDSEFSPKILGPETLGIHGARVDEYLGPMDTSQLYGVAHHLYAAQEAWRSPDGYVQPMRGVASSSASLPIFMTEYGTEGDQGIEGGFEIAWLMHNSIVEGNASAFLYWELYWPDKGLLAVTFDPEEKPRVRDHYYAMRHFSRFTDPGHQRIEASSSSPYTRATAYVSPEGDQVSVVLLNVGSEVQEIEIQWGTAPTGLDAKGYRTIFEPGHSDTWSEIEIDAATPTLVLPPGSMATVVGNR